MDIAYLDYLSSSGNSVIHRASTTSKIAMAALCVAAAILSTGVRSATAVFAAVAGLAAAAGIPAGRMGHLLLYPAFFGWVFSTGDPVLGVLRSVSAAAALIVLLGTTTFVSLHSVLERVLPGILADSVYMTYRSFFLLAGRLTAVGRVLRLKGARSPSAIGAALGTALIRSIDLSERTYRVLVLRGYATGIRSSSDRRRGDVAGLTRYDALPVIVGLALLCLARTL